MTRAAECLSRLRGAVVPLNLCFHDNGVDFSAVANYVDWLCSNRAPVILLTYGRGTGHGMRVPSGFLLEVPDLDWTMAGTGDFNGDHQVDILWRHQTTGENVIWLMNGTQRQSGVLTTTVSDLFWQIGAVGDIDGDNQDDILWRNRSTSTVVNKLLPS